PLVVLRDTGRIVMLAWERRSAPVPASLGMREVVKGSYGLYAIHTPPASASSPPPVHRSRCNGGWCWSCRCPVGLSAGDTRSQGRARRESALATGEALWGRTQLENGAFTPLHY